jgi:undecaprenyl-diphosphatase
VVLLSGVPASIRIVAWAVAFFVSALVAVSRVYLDAQWASDVIAGILLGLALTAVFAMIRNGFQDEVGRKPQVPLIGFAAFLAIAAVKSSITFDDDLARSAPRVSIVDMAEVDWLADGWAKLPQRRIDLFGETEEPMFLQTALDPAMIAPALAPFGWQPAGAFTATDLLFFLVPAAPLDSFPPLPLLHGGRPPEVTFTKPGATPEKRLVLRLWLTNFTVRQGDDRRALMVGSVTEERVSHPYDAMTVLLDRAAGPTLVDEARSAVAAIGLRSIVVTEKAIPGGSVVLLAPRRL